MNRTRFKTENGEIVAGKENLKRAFDKLKQTDGDWCAELKKWTGEKTYLQIKTVKGVLIPEYSTYTGYTIDEAERRLKYDYGETIMDEIDKQQILILKSFRYYTKKEMRLFITKVLEHLEFDCGFIIDLETRKKLHLDEETGELKEIE